MTDKFGRPLYGDSKIGEERETDTGEFLKSGDLASLDTKGIFHPSFYWLMVSFRFCAESERREKEQTQGAQGGIKGAEEPHIVHKAPHQGIDARVPWSENKSVPIREPRGTRKNPSLLFMFARLISIPSFHRGGGALLRHIRDARVCAARRLDTAGRQRRCIAARDRIPTDTATIRCRAFHRWADADNGFGRKAQRNTRQRLCKRRRGRFAA